jgi:putative nucleotidyltransferase with HDIG domain
MNFLNQLTEDFLTEKDIESLLKKALGRIRNILGADRATFYFFNEDTLQLASFAATELEIKEIRIPLGRGIAGKAALLKRMLNIKDASLCRYFDKSIDKKTGYRTKTVLCNPLFGSKRKLLGAIEVLNKRRGYFTKEDEESLKGICFYLAVSLENMKLSQEAEALLRSTLYALAGAIDAKDPVTAGHSYRVAYLSVKTAKELGCSEEDVRIVEYAAYLHDVGKIGIPDHLLSKPDKLTEKESTVMRRHPLHTLQIFKNIVFSKEARDIPLIASYHHEYLDGSGYPFGLKKEKLNIFARMITLADIYDALVSFDRPYKKSFSPEKALEIIRDLVRKGRLDKRIATIFINRRLYRYERRRYERLDRNILISYEIIPQAKIFKQDFYLHKKVAQYDLDVLAHERRKSLVISRKGVLFLTKAYLPAGIYLDLEIEILSRKIKCIGKVVWVERVLGTPYYRVGASFVAIKPKMKKALSMSIEGMQRANLKGG